MRILFFLPLLALSGCEGFKVLSIRNFSNTDARIVTKPGITRIDRLHIANYPSGVNIIGDSATFVLPADSSFVITSVFTSFLSGAKIRARDIKIHYLRIETPHDTITAHSEAEILQLLHDDRFRYKKDLGRERRLMNSKNFGNIIIQN
ncbi:MAG: hypothetical protein KDC61_10170 [Saprospiraceae bacterium]|nr:hypothetical protein [Saprospiraceae bacterium]MCB0574916.1 hypothetical protein [Saprospiraceae bacterium]MCB9305089.1 hypothetical protein [Lewinellaceae bacterium]MCB9353368.1 hypothetical protein [Lewinellaceae bacterium]